MATQPLPADQVACYECGTPTPASDGPLCWACTRRSTTQTNQDQRLLTLLEQQARDVERIRKSVGFLAFVVFIGIALSLLGMLIIGAQVNDTYS